VRREGGGWLSDEVHSYHPWLCTHLRCSTASQQVWCASAPHSPPWPCNARTGSTRLQGICPQRRTLAHPLNSHAETWIRLNTHNPSRTPERETLLHCLHQYWRIRDGACSHSTLTPPAGGGGCSDGQVPAPHGAHVNAVHGVGVVRRCCRGRPAAACAHGSHLPAHRCSLLHLRAVVQVHPAGGSQRHPASSQRHPASSQRHPSELLASPSELLASPSELSASPSELLASPQRALSVTQQALSVTQRALRVTQQAFSVTQRARSLPPG
jgi:hypothetical protein